MKFFTWFFAIVFAISFIICSIAACSSHIATMRNPDKSSGYFIFLILMAIVCLCAACYLSYDIVKGKMEQVENEIRMRDEY